MVDPFEYIASLTGATPDQIKLIVSFLINFPLASLFIRVPPAYPALRHLFHVVITFGVLVGIFKDLMGTCVVLGTSLVTYALAKYVRSTNMPWLVFAFTMTTLSASHIYRMVAAISVDQYEISGAQMVLTMKLTTFAWNIYDGRRPFEELDAWQKTNRIERFPSLLEFLGFISFFPGFQAGPAVEYASYSSSIKGAPLIPEDIKALHGNRRMPRGRKRAAYMRLLTGLVMLGAYVTLGPQYNFETMLDPKVARMSILYRIFLFQVAGLTARMKYYAAWKMCEGASILTGMGFSGWSPTGISLWDGASNVDIIGLETAENWKVLLDAWNMKTNQWLRECVYKRVTPKGKKPGFRSTMITFTTSAFWHGFAPGYYILFTLGGLIQTLARLCRSTIRPLVIPPVLAPKDASAAKARPPPPPQTPLKRAYDLVGTVFTIGLLNFIAASFILLDVSKTLRVWAVVRWYGHFVMVFAFAFFYGGGAKLLKGVQAARVKRLDGSSKVRPTLTPSHSTDAMILPPVDRVVREAERVAPLTR